MNGIRAEFLIRATVCCIFSLFVVFYHSYEVRAESSCVTCHTDEEMLTKSLGKDDKEKSSLQAGPG